MPCCHACVRAMRGHPRRRGRRGYTPCRGLVEGAPRIFLAATAAATDGTRRRRLRGQDPVRHHRLTRGAVQARAAAAAPGRRAKRGATTRARRARGTTRADGHAAAGRRRRAARPRRSCTPGPRRSRPRRRRSAAGAAATDDASGARRAGGGRRRARRSASSSAPPVRELNSRTRRTTDSASGAWRRSRRSAFARGVRAPPPPCPPPPSLLLRGSTRSSTSRLRGREEVHGIIFSSGVRARLAHEDADVAPLVAKEAQAAQRPVPPHEGAGAVPCPVPRTQVKDPTHHVVGQLGQPLRHAAVPHPSPPL